MAYNNRKKLLLNTIRSIKPHDNIEIIIVDDASVDSQRIEDIPSMFEFDIKIIRVNVKDKWWTNPCIPYNMGFNEARGDMVLIQNPECYHSGNILKYVSENVKNNVYLNFACYSLSEVMTEYLNNVYMSASMNMWNINNSEWYNHSIHKPTMLHFCSAIMKKDLDKIGGFDEKYATGLAFDDNDFLLKIQRQGMEIRIIDNPFVYHQYHMPTDYHTRWDLYKKNQEIYNKTLNNEL